MTCVVSVFRQSALVAAALGALSIFPADAAEVRVGGYEFPPFVDKNAPNGGLAPSFVKALNDMSSKHTFTFVPTSPQRRYGHFRDGRFDMIMFEMPIWGWESQNLAYETTPVLLEGGEVYVAHKASASDQSFFDWLHDKRLVGLLGYHYGFADFNGDREFLEENYDIELTTSHRGNLGMVLKRRVDVAVVTKSFLQLYFIENPAAREELVLSHKLDQEYRLPVIVSKDSPVGAAELSGMLEGLEQSGAVDTILNDFGLAGQWVF